MSSELVDALREGKDHGDGRTWYNPLHLQAAERIEALEAALEEARDSARDWHRQCETVATILDLPEPEGAGRHAEMVRTKFEDLDAENARLREAFFMPDADRRHWHLCDLIARVGHFNRSDLCKSFGVSAPQASSDIKRFLTAFPHVAIYNKSSKRYERRAREGGNADG